MKTVLRNVLAVLVGFATGSIVNMGLVMLGPKIIAPPAGVDAMDAASISAGIHAYEPQHYLFPFLAHALGTLTGALVAFVIARGRRAAIAFGVGGLFLAGGVAAAAMIPATTWFVALDLVGAYLPMAWLATRLGRRLQPGVDRAA